MAESSNGGATSWLAIGIGALLLALAVVAFVFYGRAQLQTPRSDMHLEIALPKAPLIPDAPRLPSAPTPIPK